MVKALLYDLCYLLRCGDSQIRTFVSFKPTLHTHSQRSQLPTIPLPVHFELEISAVECQRRAILSFLITLLALLIFIDRCSGLKCIENKLIGESQVSFRPIAVRHHRLADFISAHPAPVIIFAQTFATLVL